MNKLFGGTKVNGFEVICNSRGELQGKWDKGPMMTLTHQSVLLGIPAMQLEIP